MNPSSLDGEAADGATPSAAHRANTYPFIHAGIISAFLNVLVSAPLIQRFEVQHGTLATLALFFGRELMTREPGNGHAAHFDVDPNHSAALSTFPAFLYVLVDKLVFHTNAALMGAR